MLVFLPLLVWIALVILWLGGTQKHGDIKDSNYSIRFAAILACIFWAAGLALSTELLSLFSALTTTWVALTWTTALVILFLIIVRGSYLRSAYHRLAAEWSSLRTDDLRMLGVLGLLSGLLLFVTLKAPSGNTDSLIYHLSRVMHWAQNASLGHYATGSVQQLFNPIWAEEVILHLRLLWGNDRLAGLVQWSAMLFSMAAVMQIASELGVGRRGQWIAAAFAFSLPMGILQSVSTQNDYVVAFWLLCVAWLCLRASRHHFTILEALALGLAVGLGLLTKGTFYPYAVPFGLWFLFTAISFTWKHPDRIRGIKRILVVSGIIVLVIVLLNVGYWLRNLSTFGTPMGPPEWVEMMTAGQYNLGAFFASLIGQAAMNFTTPLEGINSLIIDFFRSRMTEIDSRMSGFNLFWGWNHEDLAGNPLHVLFLALAFLALLYARRRVQDRRLWIYLAAVLGALAMLVLVVHFEIYGVRFQLPLFILSAPLFGASIDTITAVIRKSPERSTDSRRSRIMTGWNQILHTSTLLLFLASLPWILINRSRPILALKEGGEPYSIPCLPVLGCTAGSILFEPPATSLFANHTSLREPYTQLSEEVLSSGCQQVGLRIDSHDMEYLFWWLLDAPRSGLRLETLYTFPELERYIDPDFHPCAIICTICKERRILHGLHLEGDYSVVRLYTGSGFTPDPGTGE